MQNVITKPLHEIFMHTASGAKYYPFAPDVSMVDIHVIAHHLACAARWSGATIHRSDPDRIFYSVAEHSVYVSEYVEYTLGRPDLALTALLHDGVEGYIGDLIRPLKYSAEFYAPFKRLEDLNEEVLARALDLKFPWPPAIKIADEAVCAAEWNQIVPRSPDENWEDMLHDNRRVASISIVMMQPKQARDFFIGRYWSIKGRIARETQKAVIAGAA